MWSGFAFVHRTRHVGISVRRADRCSRWLQKSVARDVVQMASFFGTLCEFFTHHPRASLRRARSYVACLLRYLAGQITKSRLYICAPSTDRSSVAPRVDAQVLALAVVFQLLTELATLMCGRRPGSPLKMDRSWTRENDQGDWPALIITTLEALAVLVALKVYYGE